MIRRHAVPVLVAALAASVAIGCGGESGSRTGGGSSGSGSSASATNGTFEVVGELATARTGHSVSVMETAGKVLIAGGFGKVGGEMVALNTAEVYDIDTGRVSPVRNTMNAQRGEHGAAALATGTVILAGGRNDSGEVRSIETYNPSTGNFDARGNLANDKAEPIVLRFDASGAQNVLVAGGRVGSTGVRSIGTLIGDSANHVAATQQLGTGRYAAHAAMISSDEAIVFGGGSANVEKVTIGSNGRPSAVSAHGSLPGSSAHYRGAAAELDGQVALIGGRSGSSSNAQIHDSILVYTGGAFETATARLPQQLFGHAAASLPSGEVLVIGGHNGQSVTDQTVVISGSGTGAEVHQGPTLNVARQDARVAVLPNGTVLVVGGLDASGNPVRQIELFVMDASQVPAGNTSPPNQAQPIVAQLSPNQGPTGTQVTVTTNGAGSSAEENIVLFDGILAPVQSVTTNGGARDLTVTVPPGLKDGQVAVTLRVGSLSSNSQTFEVTSGSTGGPGTGGPSFTNPPHLTFVLPNRANAFIPVVLTGANFDSGSIPFINNTPSMSLFDFNISNIPLIGNISIGTTIVPPAAPTGQGTIYLEYQGRQSNQVIFTKTSW